MTGRLLRGTHWRRAAKDYGWYQEAPGLVVVVLWWPATAPFPTAPAWGHES
jgi:hypothetical protein